MQISLNGLEVTVVDSLSYGELKVIHLPKADTLIINGHSRPWETRPRSGDHVLMMNSKEALNHTMLRALYDARYGKDVMDQIQAGRVAVCGLGGLGSLVSIELARLGVGELLLIDFDQVDPTNLARQQYMTHHIGMNKTDAMTDTLSHLSSLTKVSTKCVKLQPDNIAEILASYPIICECLDSAPNKAMLINAALSQLPENILVSATGMAGYDSGNLITTQKRLSRLYVSGDGQSEGEEGIGLMAPRVGLCASAQATMVLRLLLGITTP